MSFSEALISQSGLRRANSAASAHRSIPYFVSKASTPRRCCSSWWARQRLTPKMSCGLADRDLYDSRDPAKFGATTEALAFSHDNLAAVEDQ